ncbi:MAG TPA: hypothetical protein VLU46_09915 [Thermoanaerobaculia bacterium]|nr:hypothetical protein [Thermoanaerobaculia bacterium]
MNNLNTSDVRVPSGFDVESATTHRSENLILDDHSHDAGMKDKLYHLRSRGMETWGSMRSGMSDRVSTWTPMVRDRVTTMRSSVMERISRMQGEMKSNPGKWAGIAAGAGFGIGLVGRLLRRRSRMTDDRTSIVIVGAC